MRTYYKDPNEVLDYDFIWTSTLADSETISSATITVEAGLTKDSQSNTTTTAKVWVSGGTIGNTYDIVCRITTNQGRTYERTIKIKVTDK